jgi:hypothetical protein
MNLPLMQQEYPSCVNECFQATGGGVFPDVEAVSTEHWHWERKHGYRMDLLDGHPRQDRTYVIGADAAGGTGNDEASIQILTLETFEQVLEFGSQHIDPVEFGHLLIKLGEEYNEAYMVPEGNQHGIATCSVLKKGYNRQKIYKRNAPSKKGKMQYGYWTGDTTKKELVGYILEALEDGVVLYGPSTIKEIGEFEESATGKMGAPQDGKVIALALACVGRVKWIRYAKDLRVRIAPVVPDYEKSTILLDAYEMMKEAGRKQQLGALGRHTKLPQAMHSHVRLNNWN